MTPATAFRISAAFGFLAVALGAFGAHGLKNTLTANDTLAIWQTAALYHLVHSAVLLALACRETLHVWAWRLFAAAVTLTAVGSSVYHWQPNNASLVVDRLPIAWACATLLCAFLAERADARRATQLDRDDIPQRTRRGRRDGISTSGNGSSSAGRNDADLEQCEARRHLELQNAAHRNACHERRQAHHHQMVPAE